jgi:hypothetical protein
MMPAMDPEPVIITSLLMPSFVVVTFAAEQSAEELAERGGTIDRGGVKVRNPGQLAQL